MLVNIHCVWKFSTMKSLNLEIVHVKKEEALKRANFHDSSAPSQVKVCCLAKFSLLAQCKEI